MSNQDNKRSLDNQDLGDEKSKKVHLNVGEQVNQEFDEMDYGDGEVDLNLVDQATGLQISIDNLTAIELYSLYKQEIYKFQPVLLGSNEFFYSTDKISEDDKSGLVKLLETCNDKFLLESTQKELEITSTETWWVYRSLAKIAFGRLLSIKDYFQEAEVISKEGSIKIGSKSPTLQLLTVTSKSYFLTFATKAHCDEFHYSFEENSSLKPTKSALPSEAKKILEDIKSSNLLFMGAAISDPQEKSTNGLQILLNWAEAVKAFITLPPVAKYEPEFCQSLLGEFSKGFKALTTTVGADQIIYELNSFLLEFYESFGEKYPELIKSILSDSVELYLIQLDEVDETVELYCGLGKTFLSLGKLSEATLDLNGLTEDQQEECTSKGAEYFSNGIEAYENALSLEPENFELQSYIQEILSPLQHEEYEQVEDDEEDEFAPEGSDEEDHILPDDLEEEDISLVVEPTAEPLVVGTTIDVLEFPEDEEDEFIPGGSDREDYVLPKDLEEEDVSMIVEPEEELAESGPAFAQVELPEEEDEDFIPEGSDMEDHFLPEDLSDEDISMIVEPEAGPSVSGPTINDVLYVDSDGEDFIPEGSDEEDHYLPKDEVVDEDED